MEEMWADVPEFPAYIVSNYGQVINTRSQREMAYNRTLQGDLYVAFRDYGIQRNRSLKVLVAECFVPGKNERFNTPMHLDGNQLNVRADNLVWRPRWYVWKYTRQFRVPFPNYIYNGPIREINTGEVFENVYEACVKHGLLFSDVWYTLHTGFKVGFYNHSFEFANLSRRPI